MNTIFRQAEDPLRVPGGEQTCNMLSRIHQDALRILEEVGVLCGSQEIQELLADTGLAAYDDATGHIHVLTPLVDQALAATPGRRDYWVPANSFGVGGTAPFVFDDDSGELVSPTLADIASIAKIVDQAEPVNFMARGVLVPDREVEVMDTMIAHCQKPIYVGAVTEAGIRRAKQIHENRGNITVQFSIINSPLNIMEGQIAPFLSCVRQGIPIYLSTMPMAGLSAPYSMSGLLTLTHAEALFGITLAQVVNPGCTVVHAGLPSIANIQKKYAVDMGLMAHTMANLLMDKICEDLDLPSIQSACGTNEERPGPQSEADAAAGYALLKKHGFHQMRHVFGFLKELVSFSLAKLERHIELCLETGAEQAAEYVVEPYDEAGVEVIARNGSRPNYMRDDHTLHNLDHYFYK
ncbi:MAG: trimethylamine--corrinoid methyltransferase [Desulfobacteraceae bacterium]|nr:trimethylamine--corrinoid methyltransferase [Desulfobacteraceae bacterium]